MSPRRLVILTMLVVPLAITAAALVVMLLAGGDLGRDVVIHWGVDGADGWGPAWTYPVLVGALGVGLPVIMWLSVARARRVSGIMVFLAGLMIWLSAFLGIGMTGAFLVQPEQVGWWLLIGAVAGLALAAPAWGWLPRAPETPSEPAELPRVALAPGQVAVWSRTVRMSTGFFWVIGLALALTLGAAILATVVTEGLAWPVFAAPLVIVVLLALIPGWRVSAGPTGLTARGLLGLPVIRVPVEDIAAAEAIELLQPLVDYGGWGYRWVVGPGGRSRTGIIVRAGQALRVTRRDGRELVVTVDDAATAAAVLRAHVGGTA